MLTYLLDIQENKKRDTAVAIIGQLHDDVILLQLPESLSFCFLVQIKAIVL